MGIAPFRAAALAAQVAGRPPPSGEGRGILPTREKKLDNPLGKKQNKTKKPNPNRPTLLNRGASMWKCPFFGHSVGRDGHRSLRADPPAPPRARRARHAGRESGAGATPTGSAANCSHGRPPRRAGTRAGIRAGIRAGMRAGIGAGMRAGTRAVAGRGVGCGRQCARRG